MSDVFYDKDGYDKNGYDRWGYDRWGYDRDGYDRWGHDRKGRNRKDSDRLCHLCNSNPDLKYQYEERIKEKHDIIKEMEANLYPYQ